MLDDLPQILQALAALIFVLALMGALAFFLKRLGFDSTGAFSGKERRLKIVETLPLDGRRKLVIVACDKKEHLVLLGPNSETVVENDIGKSKKSK